MIVEIITGNETAGNGLFAIERNSPITPMHTCRRKSLSVKLANMSGFLAVVGGDPKMAEWVKMVGL
jgi:hypothetical protein